MASVIALFWNSPSLLCSALLWNSRVRINKNPINKGKLLGHGQTIWAQKKQMGLIGPVSPAKIDATKRHLENPAH